VSGKEQFVLTSVYRLQSESAAELYITAVPAAGGAERQAKEVYAATAQAVRDAGGRIFQERVFFAPGCEQAVRSARADAYGDLDDGVAPALLHTDGNADGPICGAQVHAVVGDDPIEPVELDGRPCGRIVRSGDAAILAVAGLSAPEAGPPAEQARQMLLDAEQAVTMAGGDMFSVVRTWMWLSDLLSWYDDFNAVRNEFFRQCGLLRDDGNHRLPASTGISIAPADGGHCAMDMVAVVNGHGRADTSLLAGGDQGSAFDYGSAFSRGLAADTLAGRTVYVSGTASIDADGLTEHLDNAPAQVASTIAHVRAVLADMDCTDKDVVQAMIYCKTPDVEQVFRSRFADLRWPGVICVCDVCRDDLMFESEVTA